MRALFSIWQRWRATRRRRLSRRDAAAAAHEVSPDRCQLQELGELAVITMPPNPRTTGAWREAARLARPFTKIILNLQHVPRLDRADLAALWLLLRKLERRGAVTVINQVSPEAQVVLELTGAPHAALIVGARNELAGPKPKPQPKPQPKPKPKPTTTPA